MKQLTAHLVFLTAAATATSCSPQVGAIDGSGDGQESPAHEAPVEQKVTSEPRALPDPPAFQSQSLMNADAASKFSEQDAILNEVYAEILQQYSENPTFIAKLRVAQRAWIVFRDAHMDSKYPAEDIRAAYGSSHPLCRNTEMSRLTDNRVVELRKWLTPEEGEICGGSVGAYVTRR